VLKHTHKAVVTAAEKDCPINSAPNDLDGIIKNRFFVGVPASNSIEL